MHLLLSSICPSLMQIVNGIPSIGHRPSSAAFCTATNPGQSGVWKLPNFKASLTIRASRFRKSPHGSRTVRHHFGGSVHFIQSNSAVFMCPILPPSNNCFCLLQYRRPEYLIGSPAVLVCMSQGNLLNPSRKSLKSMLSLRTHSRLRRCSTGQSGHHLRGRNLPVEVIDILEFLGVAAVQLRAEAEAAVEASSVAAPAVLAQALATSASTPIWQDALASLAASQASANSDSSMRAARVSTSTFATPRRISRLVALAPDEFFVELSKPAEVGIKHYQASHHAGGGHELVAHCYQHYRLLCVLAGISESNLPQRSPPDSTLFSVSSHYSRLDHGVCVRLTSLLRLLLDTGAHSEFRVLRERLPNMAIDIDSMQREFEEAAFASHPVSKLLLGLPHKSLVGLTRCS